MRHGQTVCVELVASWSSSIIADEHTIGDGDEVSDCEQEVDDYGRLIDRQNQATTKIQQKQNRAVLFSSAIPYAAIRATYECKVIYFRPTIFL